VLARRVAEETSSTLACMLPLHTSPVTRLHMMIHTQAVFFLTTYTQAVQLAGEQQQQHHPNCHHDYCRVTSAREATDR
jgi:hypothetical protein